MICFDLLLLPVWSCLSFKKMELLMPSVVSVAAFLPHSIFVPSCAQPLWELTEIDTLRIRRMARAVSDKHSSVSARVTKIQTYTMHTDLRQSQG